MAVAGPVVLSGFFGAGWVSAVAGGVTLLASAFAVGAPLTVLGLVLSAGGFGLIAYSHGRPWPRRARAARPVPRGFEAAEFAADSPREEPFDLPLAPVDDALDLPGAPSFPSESFVEEQRSVPEPVAPFADPAVAALPVSPEPKLPAREPLAPLVELPVEPVVPAPPPEPLVGEPEPDPAPPSLELPPEGEILPIATEQSLALLGLPWDRAPSVASSLEVGAVPLAPAPGPTSAGDHPPAWAETPSLVFAPVAQRFEPPPEWEEGPPTLAYSEPDRSARSGAYRWSPDATEELSNPWLVPGLSVLRSPPGPSANLSLVTRVPAPPALGLREARRCSACGEPSVAGATGENRCWGCGRPVCSDCFWRYGPGPGIHRCASCAALGPSMSRSGAVRITHARGPFSIPDEASWDEGV